MAVCCGAALAQQGANQPPIDIQRAKQLFQRAQQGGQLTPDEQAYLARARQEMQRRQQGQGGGGPGGRGGPGMGMQRGPQGPVPPATSATGLVPITELGTNKYKGEDGGLYGGGSNEPPSEFRTAVEKQLQKIEPLDADGKPASDGKIVMLSVGMSNTTMEFSTFMKKAEADPQRNPHVVFVDGAQGGRVASVWARGNQGMPAGRQLPPGASADPWPVVEQRLAQAGVTPAQVQVAWIKHAQSSPSQQGEFPKHAEILAENIVLTLQKLHETFPNLRVAYLSSRIYAGYATTALNPEPYAFEGAFANRWVIQQQMKGDAKLNFDPDKGTVMAPVVLWGPYLWADGMKPRAGDGLTWPIDDLVPSDRTHPSDAGRAKVAGLLLDYLHNNPLASCWYVAK
jgi:hypothetical protein